VFEYKVDDATMKGVVFKGSEEYTAVEKAKGQLDTVNKYKGEGYELVTDPSKLPKFAEYTSFPSSENENVILFEYQSGGATKKGFVLKGASGGAFEAAATAGKSFAALKSYMAEHSDYELVTGSFTQDKRQDVTDISSEIGQDALLVAMPQSNGDPFSEKMVYKIVLRSIVGDEFFNDLKG
jgi:hypothetical protein